MAMVCHTGRVALKEGVLCGFRVGVKRLGVILRGKSDDLLGIERVLAAEELLVDSQIIQIQFRDTIGCHGETSFKDEPEQGGFDDVL
jgi:hypothetical protein